ncbi:MAG: hypothetical protein ABII82_16375 [Verrucomicrobiota bacterium]
MWSGPAPACVLARMCPPPAAAEFLFRFDRASDAAGVAVPVLAGVPHETLFTGLPAAGEASGFRLFGDPDRLVGIQVAVVRDDLETRAETACAGLLALSRERGLHPARIWNYVPGINAGSPAGLEAYRVFCRGRAQAFERAGWRTALPAASAVGGEPGRLAVVFVATRERPIARENPEQVPAFEYPPDYGPRPPSFSRATQVVVAGRRWTFVSGTAAIKGHASQASGDLAGQIACTLDNLRLISTECGLGADLAAGAAAERHFKIYLRHAADLAFAHAALGHTLFRPGDRVTWLRADICRAELLLEIEATVIT